MEVVLLNFCQDLNQLITADDESCVDNFASSLLYKLDLDFAEYSSSQSVSQLCCFFQLLSVNPNFYNCSDDNFSNG
ncbi:hypothetical protein CHUAL_000060 [Chamberlinius hualienensis]